MYWLPIKGWVTLEDLHPDLFARARQIEFHDLPEDAHEERIQSSWYHRALLFDHNRVLYSDHQDTELEVDEVTVFGHSNDVEVCDDDSLL